MPVGNSDVKLLLSEILVDVDEKNSTSRLHISSRSREHSKQLCNDVPARQNG